MNENVINALIKLYALIAAVNPFIDKKLACSFVETYLIKNFSKNVSEKQIQRYNKYYDDYASQSLQINHQTITHEIAQELSHQLHIKQKYIVLFNLLQFIKHWQVVIVGNNSDQEKGFNLLSFVENIFNIEPTFFNDLAQFVFGKIQFIKNTSLLLIMHDNPYLDLKSFKNIYHKGLPGEIQFFYLNEINTYLFRYTGKDTLLLHDKTIFPEQLYILDRGSAIYGRQMTPVYHSSVVFTYLNARLEYKIALQANQIEYFFNNGNRGLYPMSFEATSGQLIGVLGGSGTGKSTLLNLLNGNLIPQKGEITINGHPISDRHGKLNGIIGHIPQDDLLIDELTVFQNLYYSARLCFGHLSDQEIVTRVEKILVELDLFQVKNLPVGNPLNKYISGGQRKRLNIALELIREPYVLFIDEPTSGLSSTDSERVVELLKEQALKGKLLMVNIHQPSEEIFKQFDKILVLDKGGVPVYWGNPVEGIQYVKENAGMVDAAMTSSGHVNPDDLLKTIELNKLDAYGEFTNQRKVTPQEWYHKFLQRFPIQIDQISSTKLPKTLFSTPNKWEQFKVFSIRNFLAKIADTQYLTIGLLVSPVLALLLGFLTRYMAGHENGKLVYIFMENENIPAFLFMSILVALFVGLIISAEEIFRDRSILAREAFLNLSRISYLHAKILFLFVLSAMQTLSYVLVGNLMLGFNGMTFQFWMLLFSTACFANVLGLVISSAFKSAVTIYILIPLLLVPQILLSGAIVSFDKLHYSIAGTKNVPLIGDLMTSRWAYEGLMVCQFKNNAYEREFYHLNQKISEASFTMNYRISEIQQLISSNINQLKKKKLSDDFLANNRVINDEINRINNKYSLSLKTGNLNNIKDLKKLNLELSNLKTRFAKWVTQLLNQKDAVNDSLNLSFGSNYTYQLKKKNTNNRLEEFVLKSNEVQRITIKNNKVIRLFEPVYYYPDSKWGRAHFFAPVKMLGNHTIDTFWFNVMAIWVLTLMVYLILRPNTLHRIKKIGVSLKKIRLLF